MGFMDVKVYLYCSIERHKLETDVRSYGDGQNNACVPMIHNNMQIQKNPMPNILWAHLFEIKKM